MINFPKHAFRAVEPPGNTIQTHTFRREAEHWYIDLPEYLDQGGYLAELEMTEGTDKLLNTIAFGRNTITLRLSTEPFEGADVLDLIDHCEAPKGGAIYLLETCRGKEIGAFIWICDIALFVFGDIPERIYFQPIGRSRAPLFPD